MRASAAPLLLVVTGCMSDPGVAFTPLAVLQAETMAVVVHDDATADAAMLDQICVIDVAAGEVVGDLDPGDGTERLLDALGPDALASSGDLLYVLPSIELEQGTRRVLTIDAVDAALLFDGTVVALTARDEGCTVAWVGAEDTTAYAVQGTVCTGGGALTVDRATGAAWFVDGDHFASVRPDGAFQRWDDVGADLVELDPSTGQVLIAATGGDWLQALAADGTVAWTRELAGAMVDLDPAGDAGVVAAMQEQGDHHGRLELVDSRTGESAAVHPLPGPADVSFAADGLTMALRTDSEVRFYRVDPDVRVFELPEVMHDGQGVGVAGGTAAAIAGTAIAVLVILD